MDPRLLDYYNRELQFVREMGAEFAQAYPRIAARLGVDGVECADPYVERLLEGFAFLAARVQLKLDARHPDFTQHLLEMVYPHYLQPTPSCAVVELAPDLKESALLGGHVVKRGTSLRSPLVKGDRISCEFRTAHDVTLWPLIVTEAKYLSGSGALAAQGVATDGRARAAIRLRLKTAPGVKLKSLPLDSLTFHVKATADVAHRVVEQVAADCIGVYVRSPRPASGQGTVHFRPASSVRQIGLDDDEALLPVTRQGFQGYRLLQEYFAFPERFLFFSVNDLREAVQTCDGDEIELYLAMERVQLGLENALDASQFRLFCTPAINLFPLSLDRVHVTSRETEYHLVPDRNRPMDFEVHSLRKVEGIGAGGESMTQIRPFYSVGHGGDTHNASYYTIQRRPRLLSTRQQQKGARSAYVGSECFISIVDAAQRQRTGEIRQLDVQALCTNRDLPIQLATGQARTDFSVEGGAPVEAVRCIAGPSYPRQSPGFGAAAWKLISHLSLNYLSLIDRTPESGAEMLRDMLALYADPNDVTALRQVEGVRTVGYNTVVRRAPVEGPISYARGLEITITLDDAAFEGAGIVSLGSVLDRFFARYVSLNSFTQTRLASVARGVVKTWPVRVGCRRSI
ncbi:MAG TPA: type VI secretion system baseplate subunit TssF [Steroidobacter sp.]|uniref:type VI secretion system baseplate subunit TssF n=1 Tax=Steroidobacter sp. TaxID=1978227 RepID=UPI002EDB524F